MKRFLAVLLLALVVSLPAAADRFGFGYGYGHGRHYGHSRLFFDFAFGPYYAPYYYRPYYYPPYYPPVYYAPPVYYSRPPVVVQQPAPSAYCRDFRGDATIDANGQPFFGRACLQPDGQWHIVD
ncbi:MAG: hypothetical protein WCF16_00245 [Alphaproteobacteria bacterium]